MKILLIEGESGVGKTTLVQELIKDTRFNEIQSYTTREQRYPNEDGHIFVHPMDMVKLMQQKNYIASTRIANNFYCAFEHQFIEDKINLYIVDELGILDVKNFYRNNKTVEIKTIRMKRKNINVTEERKGRFDQILSDDVFDYIIEESSVNESVNKVKEII